MMIIDMLMITVIVVYIVDLSGFIDSLKRGIWRWLRGDVKYRDFDLKPFDCSLCSTWWTGLIYIIVTGEFTLINIVIVIGFSFFSSEIAFFLNVLKDLMGKIIDKLNI